MKMRESKCQILNIHSAPNEHKCKREEDAPRKILPKLVFPVSLSASHPLYVSNDAKRTDILGTMPDRTAPRPLYSASGVSRRTIIAPVAMKPRAFVWWVRDAWGQFGVRERQKEGEGEKDVHRGDGRTARAACGP